jgi:hypothetical protein
MFRFRNQKLPVIVIIYFWMMILTSILAAQDVAMEKLQNNIFPKKWNKGDSLIISGMLSDIDKMLLSKFDKATVNRFYESIEKPRDYFAKMKTAFGWDFREYAINVQEYIAQKSNFNINDTCWSILYTNNFMIFYLPAANDSNIINCLGDYLENELQEMKILLAIDDESNSKNLLIRSFYPESSYSDIIPASPELTGGKIQIILFPNKDQLSHYLPYGEYDREIGGECFYLPVSKKLYGNEYLSIRVAMVFGGYTSFPFVAHETAHALKFIYYGDRDSVLNSWRIDYYPRNTYKDLGIDHCLFENSFWRNLWGEAELQSLNDFYCRHGAFGGDDERPDYNVIFREATADYAVLNSGPLYRAGMFPSLKDLLDQKIKVNSDLISQGARGYVDYGELGAIASMLKLGPPVDRKIADVIYAWADFLKYLHDIYPPDRMRLLLSAKDRIISDEFENAFGISIDKGEQKWNQMIVGHK